MGQIRYGSASTTHAIRAHIQRLQASVAELSREFGEVNFRGEAVAGHAGFVPVGAIAVSAHSGEARMRLLRR